MCLILKNNIDNVVPKITEKGFTVVQEGYHFATNKSRLETHTPNESIVPCTIPKGAYILYDSTGLGVSNQIIINK